MVTTIKIYNDGARRLTFEGIEFAVNRDGRISYMDDWMKASEWVKRGLARDKCYDPATFNHVSTFWLGEVR